MVVGYWLYFHGAEAVQALVAQEFVLRARWRGYESIRLSEKLVACSFDQFPEFVL